MEYRKFGNTYAVRLDPGDEIGASITALAEQENITCGIIQGLGASDHADLALYDVAKKEFHTRTFDEPMEISSVNGNITRKDGEVYFHIHITLCNASLETYGGHMKACRISATGELFVTVVDGEVGRRQDAVTGLNLFSF